MRVAFSISVVLSEAFSFRVRLSPLVSFNPCFTSRDCVTLMAFTASFWP